MTTPTTPPREPMPAEPGPVPPPPGQPQQRSAGFGILPSQVTGIANGWRSQGTTVNGLDFSAFGSVTGNGGRTFAAARSVASPAAAATNSIGGRLTALADKLKVFNSRVVETDSRAGAGIRELSER
ncbi:hypothetical protein ACLQ3C_05380 [Gordonia sp. DT30]|uniref:hypothetical protein n=1 Tax=unclassified Gordonia (in: high G+C Gram-positive bacteria) TaxID=2657482 RepID=UPI003CF8416A